MLRSTKGSLMRWAKRPAGWIWLQGNYGGGKTHLGAAACNALARQQRRTFYDTVPRLVKLLRDGIKDHSVDERLERLMQVDVLMLDDLGMGQISAWGEGHLVDLMNERYQAELPTIITSNIPITAFSGAAISRCLEMCEVITLVAFDIRRLMVLRRQAGA
jgi:DNA replication protein DnaC